MTVVEYSGSATLVTGGSGVGAGSSVPTLCYSVPCNKAIALALPTDPLNDPLLIDWTKPSYKPIIRHAQDWNFRDPTTA